MNRYQKLLGLGFVAVWIWAAIHPLYRHDWLLENYLVFIFVPLILLGGRYFRLSDLSYTLITLFLILHVIGSHYTYAEVPFGETLRRWFGSSRNMYDRLVHFSFGFLVAYPVREAFLRLSKVKGFCGYYLPLDLVLAGSAIYEIIEWLTAAHVDATAGLAFLGSQGDVWDTQKDMLMAALGALLAMAVIFFVNAILKKDHWSELRDSFRIAKDDEPLGEYRLRKMIKEKE